MTKKLLKTLSLKPKQISWEDMSLSTVPKPSKKEKKEKDLLERTPENLEMSPLEETTDPEKPANPREKDNLELMSPEKNPTPFSLEI